MEFEPRALSLLDVAERLVRDGEIAPEQLEQALRIAQRLAVPLDTVLYDMGAIAARRFTEAVARGSGWPLLQPLTDRPLPSALARWSRGQALRHAVVPLTDDGQRLVVALIDPFDPLLDDLLRAAFPGRTLGKRLASRADLHDLVQAQWGGGPDFRALEEMVAGRQEMLAFTVPDAVAPLQPPVIALCDAMLDHAVVAGASDIHLDPGEHVFTLRVRIDGQLRHLHSFEMVHWQPVLHRFKIMAQMDIGRHLGVQGGQFVQRLQGRRVNFRAAVVPALHAECLVLRVLDQRRGGLGLADLGLLPGPEERLRTALARPDGLILVGGPIASGKTTTATALLGELAHTGRCIVTLEDPVEVVLAHARQLPVRPEQGLGFADLMREVLRQDPDVVFLGEVRDSASAALTVATAMIGKRMLATIHARDAVAAVSRLLSLQADAGAVAEWLVALTSQRLLPRACPVCRTTAAPGARTAPGCDACAGTGVRGRLPVVEVLLIDEPMRDAIAARDLRRLRNLAHAAMRGHDLVAQAQARVAAGDVDAAHARALVAIEAG